MKTLILASLLTVTAVSGLVTAPGQAKADYNYYSNGMFGHTFSPIPTYNPVLPLAGARAGAQPGAAAAQTGGFDGSDDDSGSLVENAVEAVESLLDDDCE